MSIPILCTRHCLSSSHQQPHRNRSPYKAHRQTSIPPQNILPPNPHQKSHPIQPLPPNPPHIWSTDTFFDQRSRELIECLTKCDYSRTSLQKDANRVRSIPHHATIQPQEQKPAKTDRSPFVTSFNTALPKISSVVNKYTTLLQSTANCKKAFLTHQL